MYDPPVIVVSALAKLGICAIFSFCAWLGAPYAADVQALPWATVAVIHSAPSMRTSATRWPPGSMTAKDMGGVPSCSAACFAAAHSARDSSEVSMPPILPRAPGRGRSTRSRPSACR